MGKQNVNYQIDKGKTPFVNPYNFVRVDFGRKSHASVEEDVITGWIDYRIITRTPLAIPDAGTAKGEVIREKGEKKGIHKQYDFMKTPNGEYMIPGSSIRGVIRNVYETATDSCFSTLKDRQMITTRQTDAGKPGIIEIFEDDAGNRSLTLVQADYYMLKVRDHAPRGGQNDVIWDKKICPVYSVKRDGTRKYISFGGEKYYSGSIVHFIPLKNTKTGKPVEYIKRIRKNGQISSFSCGKVAKSLSNQGSEGILVLGEDIYNKHHERIFVKGAPENTKIQGKLEAAFEGLLKTLDIYRNDAINKNYGSKHSGYSAFETMRRNGQIPVYYKWKGSNLYLQFAAIGRVAFHNDMEHLVGEKKPCKARKNLCKACSLFGMVGKEAAGSRLRFEDAKCTQEKPDTIVATLAELGAPRVAYMPFYSTMGMNDNPITIGYDDPGIGIRGRKFYWHHMPTNKILNASKTVRNATMEVVAGKTEFKGRIFFDGISENELEELIWALNFWENDAEGELCHKIGHGKPLGLGSCKLIVKGVTKRSFGEKGYTTGEYSVDYSMPSPVADSETVKDLLTISNFRAVEDMQVKYPYVYPLNDRDSYPKENDLANHKWFTENKQKRNKDKKMLLPHITEKQHLYPVTAEIQVKQSRDNKHKK